MNQKKIPMAKTHDAPVRTIPGCADGEDCQACASLSVATADWVFRAVLDAMAVAEEMGGRESAEYARLMQRIADEALRRKAVRS